MKQKIACIKAIFFSVLFFSQINFCYGKGKDSLYCNISNENDRLIFFEGKYFVRINTDVLNKDTVINVIYGVYEYLNDTIIFDFPDSLNKKNKYFGFYKTKRDSKSRFQFNHKSKDGIDTIDFLYLKMFRKKLPNYMEIRYFDKFKAVRRKNQLQLLEDGIMINYGLCW